MTFVYTRKKFHLGFASLIFVIVAAVIFLIVSYTVVKQRSDELGPIHEAMTSSSTSKILDKLVFEVLFYF
jgi:hypothetical protein